jgi:DNA-binding CsgD family transcriptional regulator
LPADGELCYREGGEAGRVVENASDPDACVIGREPELAVLGEFLGPDNAALALAFTGGPGIGKSSLWEAGVRLARARGMRALAARPSEAEARLSFAALFDLLEGIDVGALEELPSPQRRALDAVLLRAEPTREAPEPLAIAAAFLGALRSLTVAWPLLLAVDDVQWLDAGSAAVLAFAARRLRGQRCRFLLARRPGRPTEVERALAPGGVNRLEVGPLSLSATHRLLAERIGLTLPPRTLSQLFDVTHGNPLLALELGRTLTGRETQAIAWELPARDPAGNPFEHRVSGLPASARHALLAATLSGHLSQVQLATLADPVTVEDLVAAGLLAVGKSVRPSHPLLAAAVRRQSSASERRALHRDLADLVTDEILRARHLALAARVPDVGLASTIAAAAAAALRRGAAHDAVDLAEHALRLTPPAVAEHSDRLLALAECLVIVGEPPRAQELLAPRIGELPAGGARARAHLLLGEGADLAGHEYHLQQALAETEGEPALRATALATRSILYTTVRVERIREAEAWAQEALGLARSAGAGEASAERHALLALAWARTLRGRPVGESGEHLPGEPEWPGLYESSIDRPAGVRLAFRGEVSQARAVFRRLQALADERGEGRFRAVLHIQLCELELRAGDVTESSRLLDQWDEWAALEETEAIRARCQAMLAAVQGFPAEVERWAAAASASVYASSNDHLADLRWDRLEIQRARGIAALLAHQPERAANLLGPVWEHTCREGVDPGAFPVAPDLVEALLRLDRTNDAGDVTGRLRDLSERQQHPWGLATADRLAAAIALASRYDEEAAAGLAAAAATLGELGLGFDRGRSLLWLGHAARRARKRAAARRHLEASAAAFDEFGSIGWAEHARAELARLGTRRPAQSGELTAAEQRVAALAADGLSNKEIARRLFVAVHTVEVHLARAYAKLGVRSRAQLASRLAAPASPRDPQQPPR